MCPDCRIMLWPSLGAEDTPLGLRTLFCTTSKVRCPLISIFMEKAVRPTGNQLNKAPTLEPASCFDTTYSTCNEGQGAEYSQSRIILKGKYWCSLLVGTFQLTETLCVAIWYIQLCRMELFLGREVLIKRVKILSWKEEKHFYFRFIWCWNYFNCKKNLTFSLSAMFYSFIKHGRQTWGHTI